MGLPFSQREEGTIVSGVIDGLKETLSNGQMVCTVLGHNDCL